MEGKNKKERNILIISMSKLPFNPSENYYMNISEDFYFIGVSQLEPGTKFFLRKLQKENRIIDKIFIVESEKSREKTYELMNKVSAFIPDIWQFYDDQSRQKISAVDFYKARIYQYIHNNERSFKPDKNIREDRIKNMLLDIEQFEERNEPLNEQYKESDTLFEDVELKDVYEYDEDNRNALYSCIFDLCNKIQRLQNQFGDIHLFVDMQGARRYETFIINAAVKMLELNNIKVETSIATDYDYERNLEGKFYEIVDTTFNDRIFEMVSGMNEFIYSGRGNQLKKFWNNSNYLPGIKLNKDEEEIINRIGDISDSISLCSVQNFDKNLADLRKALEDYKSDEELSKNQLFACFVDSIQNDYDNYHLLSGTWSKAIDQIDWCVSKGLYQQALTLVESKLPDDIVNARILYYEDDESLKELLHLYLSSTEFNPPGYNLDNGNNVTEGKEKFTFIKYLFAQDTKIYNLEEEGYYGKIRIESNINTENGIPEFVPFIYKALPDYQIVSYDIKEDIQGVNEIIDLLKHYFILAKARNLINHGAGDQLILSDSRDDIQTIKGELKDCIQAFKTAEAFHIDYSEIVRLDLTPIKEMQTFNGLPVSEEEIMAFLEPIWGGDQNAIKAFAAINNAIKQMDGLTWKTFQRGESTRYYILNQLIEFLILNGPNADAARNNADEFVKIKMGMFKSKNGKSPYSRFVNSIKGIHGFYPEKFHFNHEE